MAARFITFEGIDGAGKSTHIAAVAERLCAAGARVLCTREPGGTPLAEQLRELVLHQGMDALTEALLVFAARRDHLQHVIEPALARGDTVLCDRFTDATFAYQGGGRGFDVHVLGTLETWVHRSPNHGPNQTPDQTPDHVIQPDLTLWFDVDARTAAERRGAARAPDRFEQQDEAFFGRVRAAYVARMEAAPQRFVRIDAGQGKDAVWRQVVAALERRGW